MHRSLPKSALGRATAIKVADTLTALGDLAHYRRQQFAPKVLAITGSNGKTTTKEMVAAILEEAWAGGKRRRGKILKTEGNFNNLVGLPLTLLRLRKQDKVAVVELGTNQPGEIQRLTEIADPDIGIITSVAAAHLEGLNSLAGVAREKGALYRGMRAERHDCRQPRRSVGSENRRALPRAQDYLRQTRLGARAGMAYARHGRHAIEA